MAMAVLQLAPLKQDLHAAEATPPLHPHAFRYAEMVNFTLLPAMMVIQ